MRQVPRDFGLTARMFFTMFLLAALYLLFGWVLYNAGVGFAGMIIIVGAMLLIQYFFSDRLVLLSTGAREVSTQEAPELHAMVYRLAVQAGIPKPKVAVVPTPAPNAFATGRSPGNSVVAVTQGLLDRLRPQEVEAVLAHELSHVKNRDVAVMTLASFFATLASFLVQNFFFYGGFGGGLDRDREDRGGGALLVFLVSLLVWVISFFLIRALSRYREFAADRGAAYLTGAPANLRAALVKISGAQFTRAQALGQTDAVNAFLIIPSLKGAGETIGELFSTHPSLKRRLEYLAALEHEINA